MALGCCGWPWLGRLRFFRLCLVLLVVFVPVFLYLSPVSPLVCFPAIVALCRCLQRPRALHAAAPLACLWLLLAATAAGVAAAVAVVCCWPGCFCWLLLLLPVAVASGGCCCRCLPVAVVLAACDCSCCWCRCWCCCCPFLVLFLSFSCFLSPCFPLFCLPSLSPCPARCLCGCLSCLFSLPCSLRLCLSLSLYSLTLTSTP